MKMKPLSAEERGQLETVIGHVFADKQWLDRALTHASTGTAKNANYERLEFLGDRVLGLCVAELLFTTFRSAEEGELSVRLNQLVSAESCATVADELELHRFIRTGADVKKLTGKRMLNVRADVWKASSLRSILMVVWKLPVLLSCVTGRIVPASPMLRGAMPRQSCKNGRMRNSIPPRPTGWTTVRDRIMIRASR